MLATDYLERTARRLPDKVAVTDEVREMTYGELWREAQALGACLAVAGLDREPVAIWLGREGRHIAATQGAALSGRPYAPLDMALPERRLLRMLEVLRPGAVISDQRHREGAEHLLAAYGAGGNDVPRLLLYEDMLIRGLAPEAMEALAAASARRLPDDPLCILFTSGSTGTPKAVAVSHELICRQIEAGREIFGLDASQVRAGQVPLHFTMAAYDEVYSVLSTGGRLLLLPPGAVLSPVELMRRLRREGVNTVFWVPSMMRLLLLGGALELPREELPELRFIAFAGEQMPLGTLRPWREKFSGARFFNRYGTTEVGMAACFPLPESLEEFEVLPMGCPVPGQAALLLDSEGREVTRPGGTGEIYWRGSLGLGYWRQPDLTAAAFIQNPLNSAYRELVYRSGDLARLEEDGSLTYLCRLDHQIKHMGYRIELGEIEAAAAELPGLMAACLYREETDELVLFYAGEMSPREIMKGMSELLPRYMWPARLEKMEELPYTGSGKIDRQALKRLLAELK